ncbi:Xaa-Pro aminopeptidase [Legionella impletisoli]|uniref:Xaa-Pro aminopeptidase n=1 Tax=Legionella impletisoli TaxID=343510 RepID=A0A917JUR2_9GAMM|nr:Xaa-Pro aminopeptidase [Legionella impletisoli]GGI87132.1 Xaa-Pro aminopeptidase [Legionella impletisoli]
MISKKEYVTRRQSVAMQLEPDSVALIPAAREALRSGDSHYRFRQDSDFYYLTGFNEPDALLVITSGRAPESILFNRPKDPAQELWTGLRLGQEDALSELGVDAAFSVKECNDRLVELLSGKKAVYFPLGRYPHWDERIKQAWHQVKGQIRKGIQAPDAFCDITPIISELRLFKSEAELSLMQKAASISVAAHQRVMKRCSQAQYEYELEAELIYEFIREGCRSYAYDPIVAGGKNACILHYTENNAPLKRGELLLVDAGGEYQNYAADITRTYPLNGVFTAEQRALYELVLKAQKAGLEQVRPGQAWNEIQMNMVRVLTQGLIDLKLLHGEVDSLIEEGAYKEFYMHNSGHWLGLDVHDSGAYKRDGSWRMLEEGMVLTVEPGIYIRPDHPHVDERWLGIGIRIEDDIEVTRMGHHNLTAALAVEVDELEAIVRG